MTFDAFLETAWNDHGDRPQEVADRLASSLHVVETAEHIPPFARILTHVYGEHLGQWDRGVALLESLRRAPAFDGSAAAAGALDRSIATLHYAGGETSVLEPLAPEDRIGVLALAASALSGRNEMNRAIAAYTEALQLAHAGLPPGSAAIRALAIGGNNLAAALEEKKDRDAAETAGMLVAARGRPCLLETGGHVAGGRARRISADAEPAAGGSRQGSDRKCPAVHRRLRAQRRTGHRAILRLRRACAGAARGRRRHGIRRVPATGAGASRAGTRGRQAMVPIRPGGTRRLIQRNPHRVTIT